MRSFRFPLFLSLLCLCLGFSCFRAISSSSSMPSKRFWKQTQPDADFVALFPKVQTSPKINNDGSLCCSSGWERPDSAIQPVPAHHQGRRSGHGQGSVWAWGQGWHPLWQGGARPHTGPGAHTSQPLKEACQGVLVPLFEVRLSTCTSTDSK